MSNELRKQAAEELAINLGCSLEIAENILKGMDEEAKEQQEVSNECACEMA